MSQRVWDTVTRAVKKEDEPAKAVYGWSVILTLEIVGELSDNLHAVTSLVTEVMRVSTQVVYFPTHLKLFNLLVKLVHKSNTTVVHQFEQYILYIFDQVNFEFFSHKGVTAKTLSQKDAWMFERLDNLELREKMVKDACEALIQYYSLPKLCGNISFPEFINPTQVIFERFKKNTTF